PPPPPPPPPPPHIFLHHQDAKRASVASRGLGDVYKRQPGYHAEFAGCVVYLVALACFQDS
ncbi:hypothetical protein QN353_21330, partial [Undibacterium sp. 10I3]|nr:hypothetical protein [Undibacterium sp. 10I3]